MVDDDEMMMTKESKASTNMDFNATGGSMSGNGPPSPKK